MGSHKFVFLRTAKMELFVSVEVARADSDVTRDTY
jgi:hypothetical protein